MTIYVLFVDGEMKQASTGCRMIQIYASNEKRNGHEVRIDEVYPSGRIEDVTKEILGE